MGSAACGAAESDAPRAYHQSANVGQFDIMRTPVNTAMMSDTTNAMTRSAGPTGTVTGRPLMKMTPPEPGAPNVAGFSARNAPYNTANVAAVNTANSAAWMFSVVQNTSAYPSDPNQSAST